MKSRLRSRQQQSELEIALSTPNQLDLVKSLLEAEKPDGEVSGHQMRRVVCFGGFLLMAQFTEEIDRCFDSCCS